MSYVALATDRFDEVTRFYADLGFATLRQWDRADGRGRVFDLRGMAVEILDAVRERRPLELAPPRDRVHLVVEVNDVDELHRRLAPAAAAPQSTSWGSRVFRMRDPDGVWLTFLQWTQPSPAHPLSEEG
jgi:catechol 2,3-dioxygenase-like lactoylglutathione lyase family enzyme